MDPSIASHYSGAKGIKYANNHQTIMNHLGHQLNSKFFIPHLNTDMCVLDFGCGNGSIAKSLQPYVKSIEGLEVNPYARDLAIKQGISVYDSITSIPSDKQFDAIISNHVLEHIPDVVTTLKLLRKHLSKKGKFVTMLPIEDFRQRRNRTWNPSDKDHHLHTWTPLLFGNTLEEAGLEPSDLKIINHYWKPQFFFLGDTWLQKVACYILSIILKQRQLRAIAHIAPNNTT